MTYPQNEPSLSGLEQAVLARLGKSTKAGELVKDVAKVASPGTTPDRARAAVDAALATLRRARLVHEQRLQRTKAGTMALCEALVVKRAPGWKQFYAGLAARALGLPAGSEQAQRALKTKDSIAIAVLRERGPLPAGKSMVAVCDSLIAEVLGMPSGSGKLTLKQIRAHVLARRVGHSPPDEPLKMAAALLHTKATDKMSLLDALVRRGTVASAAPRDVPAQPLHVVTRDHELLELVRSVMPRVGADGRVGSEKVFVSAIWDRIVSDGRASELSLDEFKRWLVTANRDELLELERADAVGAMDAKLVAASEIKNLNTTFHFVIDPHAATQAAGL